MSGKQLFPLAVLAALLTAALLYVRKTAVSTGGFSSATHSSAALRHGQQMFSLAVLAALLTAALLCATDNRCFH